MREIPAAAQDEIRRRAIAALNSGVKQVEVARVMSLPERTIRRWVAQMKREYGIALSAASIGNYLKRWGMSPQKPVRRAYERDDTAIQCWLETDYPAIAADAKRRRALIFWADECGVRSDDVRGRSFALKGRTAAIRTTGQRFGCSMISAVSNRGALAFRVFEGRFHAQTFIDFMQRLQKHGKGRKIALIVDRHPVHKSNAVKRWIADQADTVILHFLPDYAPELNPDELLHHDLKPGLTKRRPRNRAELKFAVRSHLHKRQKQPRIVKNFFKEKHVRYAA